MISLLSRSSRLDVLSRRRCSGGSVKTVRPLGTLAAIQVGKFGRRLLIFLHGQFQTAIRFLPVGRIEDGSHIGSHLATHRNPGHVVAGVLLNMELTTLPRHAGETEDCRHRIRRAGKRKPVIRVRDVREGRGGRGRDLAVEFTQWRGDSRRSARRLTERRRQDRSRHYSLAIPRRCRHRLQSSAR